MNLITDMFKNIKKKMSFLISYSYTFNNGKLVIKPNIFFLRVQLEKICKEDVNSFYQSRFSTVFYNVRNVISSNDSIRIDYEDYSISEYKIKLRPNEYFYLICLSSLLIIKFKK